MGVWVSECFLYVFSYIIVFRIVYDLQFKSLRDGDDVVLLLYGLHVCAWRTMRDVCRGIRPL